MNSVFLSFENYDMIEVGLNLLKDNLEKSNLQTSLISEETGAFQYENSEDENVLIEFNHDKSQIHFIFSLSGEVSLNSNSNDELAKMNGHNFFVFSNPYESTTLKLDLAPSTKVLSIVITIKELHGVFGSSFGKNAEATKEFMESYKMKKFFIEKTLTPSISILVHSFFSGVKRDNLRKIYQQGKVMEFLSIYMDSPSSEEEADDMCPFVVDALELKKIKEARDIIISDLIDPPSLKSLAKQVGTNEFKLKFGFKSVFRNTVYGYLAEYRLEQARKLLTVDNCRIKDVATQVGYSNASHFITAYKKKYGVTPKQHVISLVS